MRSIWLARLQLFAVLLAPFGWLLCLSYIVIPQIIDTAKWLNPIVQSAVLLLITLLMFLHVTPLLPLFASRCGIFPGRAVGLLSLVGVFAIWLGLALTSVVLAAPEWDTTTGAAVLAFAVISVLIGTVTRLLIHSPEPVALPRF